MEKTIEQSTDTYKIKYLPLGFFDSGVGGLSVYARFKKVLPNENTIYFGDLKNMPYGNKTKEELLGFARKILDFFKTKNVKAVVIACNTSSATVYEEIKNEYDFKVYPIIQSCAKVISDMDMAKAGVFATLATIESSAYKREIQKYNPNIQVFETACPNWTSFVEHGQIESPECIEDIKNKMGMMLLNKPEKIILGCTHYPYLLNVLTKFAPIDMFIDPAEIFVKYIQKDLEASGLLNTNKTLGNEEFYVSANPQEFVKNAKLFYEVKTLPVIF